jgi:hypothetical protein
VCPFANELPDQSGYAIFRRWRILIGHGLSDKMFSGTPSEADASLLSTLESVNDDARLPCPNVASRARTTQSL